MLKCVLWKDHLLVFGERGVILINLKQLHEKHAVEALKLRAIPRLPWRQRNVKKRRVEMAFSRNI